MNRYRSKFQAAERRTEPRSASPLAGVAAAAFAALLAVGCNRADSTRTSSARPADTRTQAELLERGKQISYSSACHDCHTPGGLYGNPDGNRLMAGSELGWEGPWGVTYPRNLTPDPETGIASWTEEDIVKAIRTGMRPDGTALLPPMPWPVYSHMSDEDAYALAAFIKSLPAIRHKVPSHVPAGTVVTTAKVTIPPAPEWDGRHLSTAP